MEDWEEDEKIPSLLSKEPAVKGNWDDEDVDENDVKDSWEDDDEPAPPVKVSELSLDTFRMLQSLEWEPSGSFYQSNVARNGQNGAPGPGRINYSQEIADPTLPHNPRKAGLYCPSVTHFLAVSMIGINCLFLYSLLCFIGLSGCKSMIV